MKGAPSKSCLAARSPPQLLQKCVKRQAKPRFRAMKIFCGAPHGAPRSPPGTPRSPHGAPLPCTQCGTPSGPSGSHMEPPNLYVCIPAGGGRVAVCCGVWWCACLPCITCHPCQHTPMPSAFYCEARRTAFSQGARRATQMLTGKTTNQHH